MVSVLTITCVVAGIALSFTYTATKDAIVQAETAARLASVRTVIPPFNGEPVEEEYEIEGTAHTFFIGKKDGKVVGVATPAQAVGYGGTVNILVGMNPTGKVTGIVLLQHQETPGLGTKAGLPQFLEQFTGRKLEFRSDEMLVKKDGGDIDAVTAATITSRAVTKATTEALRRFLKIKEELL